ncbi:thioredoxin domain-containing protein [Streptomyces sp. SID4948]|nr:thioredoxin domain-containing protein [Streptomyces sp. SID4948]
MPVRPSIPVTVTIYEDLRSPVSKAFAEEYQPVLTQLLTTGQMQIHYRLVSGTDKKYGGDGSLLADNAAACAQDQGRFSQFVDQVFKNQPDPQDDSLAKESVLKHLALKAHKIQMSKFEPCVEQRDHLGWAAKSQAEYAASGIGALPVVQINDTTFKNVASKLTPKKLHSLVLGEAKRVIKIQDTASPTPSLTPTATPSTTG